MTIRLKMYELQSLLMDFQQLSLEAITLAQGTLPFSLLCLLRSVMRPSIL